jgi:hypothetical protein
MRQAFRAFASTVAAAALLAGAAHAASIVSLETLKKGEALPAGQAALLMVVDRGTQHSAMKNPEPLTFVIVSVATGESFRVADVDDAKLRVIAPGKYYLKDAFSQSRNMEVLGVHDASQAFEVKAGVLTYVGAWKFSNNMSKTTQTIGLEISYAVKPLERALTDHPQFVGDGMVFVTGPGQAAKALGGK